MLNLANYPLRRCFLLALALQLIMPQLLTAWRLCWLAPVLVVSWYQKDYVGALWYSMCCGLLVDLIEPQQRFGFHAINYTAVTALLYGRRRQFFADRISTMPVMTLFFSATSTLIAMLLWNLFTKNNAFSVLWLATDVIAMSACDALYAFLIFSLPYMFIIGRNKKRRHHFLQRRRRS